MIKVNGIEITPDHFPDGTQCLLEVSDEFINFGMNNDIKITWLYENDSEMATLLFLKNHIKENFSDSLSFPRMILIMPYVPNARMDRVKSKTEVFTLKYFCDFINYLNFDKVVIFDPHSDVTPALINHVDVINTNEMINKVLRDLELSDETPTYYGTTIIYFPDAGAMKRYKDLPRLKGYEIIYGEKDRDWKTGKILGLKVFNQRGERIDDSKTYLEHKSVLMIDDIISYGGTLAYSADKLKEMGAAYIYVYASHVENSIIDANVNKVKERLDKDIINEVFTTNSIYNKGEFKNITIVKEF